MKLPKFDYLLPQSIAEACKLSARAGVHGQIIAGGTDILQALKYGLKTPQTLIDITSLPDLMKITYTQKDGLSVGPLATLRGLAAHRVVRKRYPLLAQAALSVGSVQLQAMGTLGGNLCQDTRCIYYNLPPMSRLGLAPCFKLGGTTCHAVPGSKVCWATYCGDMAPALLVLEARVTIAEGKKEKTLPLQDIFSGRGEEPHILRPGRIITAIRIPPPGRKSGLYRKMRMRKSIDYPALGVAVSLSVDGKKGMVKNVLVALTAVDKAPVLVAPPAEFSGVNELEQQIDIIIKAAHAKAHPVANMAAYTPRYRRDMVNVAVRQGMLQAMEQLSREETRT